LYNTLVGIFSEQPVHVIPNRESSLESPFKADMGRRLPLRILLAEDHPTNQKLALTMLARLGYRADVAANGLEVIEALERQAYDVILMDVQMPEMDGLETSRHIRQIWAADQGPHIIAMTANAMQGDQEACLAAGMDDYVSKPIRVEALINALNRCRPAVNQQDQSIPGQAGEPESQAEAPLTSYQSDSGNPLDMAALDQLRELVGGDEAALGELIDSFLTETPLLLVKLRLALAAEDAAGLRMAAHTLKSSSKDFGALTLAALSQELEDMGKAGSLAEAAGRVAQLETEYEPVKAALEAIREQG
jgi:CheY-like chemotaxis protein/HPt (histidine-containing phosphotransfer) domain-containing protein